MTSQNLGNLSTAVPQIIADSFRSEWSHVKRPISTPEPRRSFGFARAKQVAGFARIQKWG